MPISGARRGARSHAGFADGNQIVCDYQIGPRIFDIRDMFDGTSLDNNAALGTEPLAGFPITYKIFRTFRIGGFL